MISQYIYGFIWLRKVIIAFGEDRFKKQNKNKKNNKTVKTLESSEANDLIKEVVGSFL